MSNGAPHVGSASASSKPPLFLSFPSKRPPEQAVARTSGATCGIIVPGCRGLTAAHPGYLAGPFWEWSLLVLQDTGDLVAETLIGDGGRVILMFETPSPPDSVAPITLWTPMTS